MSRNLEPYRRICYYSQEKNGVFWRALKGTSLFALGYFTNEALSSDARSVVKKAKRCVAKGNSLVERAEAKLAELKQTEKTLDDIVLLYEARTAELKEIAKANGHWCNYEEETEQSFISEQETKAQ